MRIGRANGDDWLRLGDAAGALGVSITTLRRWSDCGKMRCYRSPGGHRRYRRCDVDDLLRRQHDAAPGGDAGIASQATLEASALTSLTTLARVAAEALDVASCRILVSRAGGDVVAAAYSRDGDTPGDRAGGDQRRAEDGAADASLTAAVLRGGRRLVIGDLRSSMLLPDDLAAALVRRGTRALLALPLSLRDGRSGAMALEGAARREFTGQEVAFVEFLAREAAALVDGEASSRHGRALPGARPPAADAAATGDGADVLRPRVARLDELAERLAAATPQSEAELLARATLDALGALPGLRSCTLYRVEDGSLAPIVWSGGGHDAPPPLRLDNVPAAAEALGAGEAVTLSPAPGLATRAPAEVLYQPLAGAGTEAVLEVTADASGALGPLRGLIDALAGDLAELLAAGGALDRLERRNRDLALVIEAGLQDSARLSSDEVFRAVVRRLAELTGSPVADLYEVEGDMLRALVSFDAGRFDEEWPGVVLPLLRYPCSRRAVETGDIVVAASLDDPQLETAGRYSLEKWGYQSQLSLPLVSGGRVLGLVELSDYVPRDFAADLELIRGLGQVAAHALENAALFEQVERRNRILNELVELGNLANQSRDAERLLRHIAERLLVAVDVANCDIFQTTDDGLRCMVSYDRSGFDELPVGSLLDPHDYPTLTRAMHGHQVLVVDGCDDPQLTPRERDTYRDFGFASEVCIPLVVNDRLYGVVDLYDTRRRDYTEYLSFLRSVGQTLGGALENSILFERLEQRTAVLREIVDLGAVASQTPDLQELLRAIAPRLRDTVQAADCDIFALRRDQLRCLVSADRNGFDDTVVGEVLDMERFPTTALAVHSGEAMVVESLEDPRLTPHERAAYHRHGFQSELCIPLIVGDQVVGLIDLFDTKPRDYAAYVDYLRSVGQIVAGAIRNALLVEELERRNAALAELVELGRSATGGQGLVALARAAGPRIVSLLGAAGCQLFTLQRGELRCLLTYENGAYRDDQDGSVLDLALFPSTRDALEAREMLVIGSPRDPRLSDDERRLYRESGTASEVCVPLVVEERVVGLLDVYDHRERDYAEYREFLLTAAQTLAGAFGNTLLLEELGQSNETLSLLNEIAGAIGASLDITDIAAAAVDRLHNIVPFDRGIVALHRGEHRFDVVYATQPRPAQVPETLALPMAAPLLARLLEEGVVALELPADLPAGLALPGVHELAAAMLVALTKGDELVGVLSLGATTPHAFAAADRGLLARTGTHLALAIDNARMYGDIKRLHLSNLKALSSALNAKDSYTLGHAARVAAYMVLLGEELGWPAALLHQVEEAAYLHDIGKIGVSDRVLLKPSGLNVREWDLMRLHPIFSADIIRSLFADDLVLGVRHHHERYDGGGYPDGLSGPGIPLVARAMCVADSYDAMSFRRPYRDGLSSQDCVAELRRCSGAQFDPGMVAAFLRVLESLAGRRRQAREVAGHAAARVAAPDHARLRRPGDETRPEYERIAAAFRAVQQANPPARTIASHVRDGKKTVAVVDSDDGPDRQRLGDELLGDDELLEVFAGREPDANVLVVDQRGVWIRGSAPLRDGDGRVEAAVTASLPATDHIREFEGLRSNVAQTLASMLHTAAVQAGRSEIEAITDGLTGLYNHRYFHERLSEELDRCLDQGGTLSLLFCDIDNFRAFNELHGHSTGDQALRAVAHVLETTVRHVDIAARFGGEEFAAILVDTDERGALEVAERVRTAILRDESAPGLSISIGVASCPADATFKEELIDKADWAMYLAKRQGRDQVMSFNARHGAATPEQAASVRSSYVRAMSELVAARDAYERRRRFATAHLSQAVGAELGLDAAALHAMAAAAEGRGPQTLAGIPGAVLELAAAYEALVAERPYREQLSEAEALDELLGCPALAGDGELAGAFARVLSGDARRR